MRIKFNGDRDAGTLGVHLTFVLEKRYPLYETLPGGGPPELRRVSVEHITTTRAQVEEILESIRDELEQLVSGLLEERASNLGMIEDVMKERGSQLLLKVFQGVVRNSGARKLEGEVGCGKCGDTAVSLGQRAKRVHLTFGEVEIERGCYWCKGCSATWAPLDGQLGIDQSGRSPRLVEAMALLGCELPFVPAAERLAQLCGVVVGSSQVEAVSEGIGRSLEAQQMAEMEAAFEKGELPDVERTTPVVIVSMDGVMVPHRDGHHETKVAAIGGADPALKKEDEELRVEKWSYVTHTGDVGTFGSLAWMESYRQGVEEAQEVVVLGDGAAWIWALAEEHWPKAVQILDFWHASEHLWSMGKALFGEEDERVGPWVEVVKGRLRHGKIKEMIRQWGGLNARSPELFNQELTYFSNQSARMNYPAYRQKGYPIGSGSVESANRHVVGVRVKQSGM